MSKEEVVVNFDERKIDSIFAELNQCQLPGAAVGIAIDGIPVYRKGFGLASIELPVILTPSMRMRIGSTSKQFTAFTYMMLCEAGLAGIDDTIGKYLPELHPVTHGVTMRQLMGNTSGLRDVNDLAFQFSGASGRPVTTDELLWLLRNINAVNAAPGTTYIYNNGGWVVLGAVIERLTGKPLEEVMRERVFDPIGMYDSLLRRWDSCLVPNSASSHTVDRTGRYIRTEPHGGIDFAGAGSLVSTVDDMLRWMAHMDAPRVGSAETWRLMKTTQVLRNGVPTGYGLGLNTSIRYRGVDTLQHGGGGFGSNVQMLKVPAARLDVIVMVNRGDAWGFAFVDKVLDACLPGLEETAVRTGDSCATGIFRSPSTGRVIQLFEKSGQQFAAFNCHEMPMEREAVGVLRTPGAFRSWDYTVRMIGDPARPSSIHFSDFGNPDELLPVQPAAKASIGALAGRYRAETIGSEVTVYSTDEGAQMRASGPFGSSVHNLQCLTDNVWRTTAVDHLILPRAGMLSFDAAGTGASFSNILNRDLRFKRVA